MGREAATTDRLRNLISAEPTSDHSLPRYLFVTPFDSPDCIEINSDDPELGAAVVKLVQVVETASKNEPPTDPFSISGDLLARLTTS